MFISEQITRLRSGRILPAIGLMAAGSSIFYPSVFLGLLMLIGFILVYEWIDAARNAQSPLLEAIGLVAILASLVGITMLYSIDPYSYGRNALIYIILLTSVSDSCALLCGKYTNTPRVWVKASPKKTWGGIIGSYLGTLLCGLLLYILQSYLPTEPVVNTLGAAVLVCLIISSCATVGDLVFSRLKRLFCIKDFGSILGGHGGFLDRFDSYIPTGIVLLFIQVSV